MSDNEKFVDLPKLPGIPQLCKKPSIFYKNQYLTYQSGVPSVKTDVATSINTVDSLQPNLHTIDPCLIYGHENKLHIPPFRPHYVRYDRYCLRFLGYFRQAAFHTPHEVFRIRTVQLLYFLDDDTITLMEPCVQNSGLPQGRLVRRSRVPLGPPPDCPYLHWKDLNIGVDIEICGFKVHLVDCDLSTREFLTSQGVLVNEKEEIPLDEYSLKKLKDFSSVRPASSPADHKLRQFLHYDGIIFRFGAVECTADGTVESCIDQYAVWFYLSDDTIQVTRILKPNSGLDPFPLLLKRTKLPKRWFSVPASYPSEREEVVREVGQFYGPRDLVIGTVVDLYGRHLLLTSCDGFTRSSYQTSYNITQPDNMVVDKPPQPPPPRVLPPYTGLGELEDSLQSCLKFIMKSPRKDIVRKIVNANHFLRYQAKLESTHPEDKDREFILKYSLADGTVSVVEPPQRNSGHTGGRFLAPMLVPKPGADRDFPEYYTPQDFAIGSIVVLNCFRFVITGADVHVYNYMKDNPEKFRPEVVESVQSYLKSSGQFVEPT